MSFFDIFAVKSVTSPWHFIKIKSPARLNFGSCEDVSERFSFLSL